MWKLHFSVLCFAIVSLWGCKELGDEGGLQTLDNFATGDAKGYATNQCVGVNRLNQTPFKLIRIEEYPKLSAADFVNNVIVIQHDDVTSVSPDTMEALKHAYAALPVQTQDLLKAFRVKVRLSNDTRTLCGSSYSGDTSSDVFMSDRDKAAIDACWRAITLSVDQHRSLEIVLKPNREDVGHYLVRQVGYLYAQYFTYLEGTENVIRASGGHLDPRQMNQIKALYQHQVQDQDMIDMKHALTVAFLGDMVQPRDAHFSLEKLDYLLGNGRETAETVRAASASGNHTLRAYLSRTTFNLPSNVSPSQRASYATGFADYVLAESFDSAFCNVAGSGQTKEGRSVNTLQRFEQLFPQSFSVWKQYASKKFPGRIGIHQALMAYSEYLTNVINQAEGGANGLRLTTSSGMVNVLTPTQDIVGNQVMTQPQAYGDFALPPSGQAIYNNTNLSPQQAYNKARVDALMQQFAMQQQMMTMQAVAASLGAAMSGLQQGMAAAQAAAAQKQADSRIASNSGGCPGGCCGPGCTCGSNGCSCQTGGCVGGNCQSCPNCVRT